MEVQRGTLYIVATPIGNLGDMTPRAIRVLMAVDVIAAEDTRHSAPLLQHFGIQTPLLAYHDHNERQVRDALLARLDKGESIALISDAGTPLISDPGYHLVRGARHAGIPVVAVPGTCAFVAALSVAGLPTDRFVFEGFLAAKSAARRARLQTLAADSRTLVFYESTHRILDTLRDMAAVFGDARHAVLCRELTKRFETVLDDTLAGLVRRLGEDENQQRGEFVVLVQGAEAAHEGELAPDTLRTLAILLRELPLKQAVALTAEISGERRNRLYDVAMQLQTRMRSDE